MEKVKFTVYKNYCKEYVKLFKFLGKGITTNLDDFNLKARELLTLRKVILLIEKKHPEVIKFRPKDTKI